MGAGISIIKKQKMESDGERSQKNVEKVEVKMGLKNRSLRQNAGWFGVRTDSLNAGRILQYTHTNLSG